MPEIRYYEVIQERQIRISANSPADAAARAERVFSNTELPEDRIEVQQKPREIYLSVREDR